MASRTIRANYVVAFTGFASPRYISADPVADSAGFEISGCKAVGISVISLGTTTIIAEQTFDITGQAGWFPVFGKRVDDSAGLVANAFAAGKAYVYPAAGVRMRFRVTALTVADIVAQISLISEVLDQSVGPGSASLPAGTNTIGGVYDVPNNSAAASLTPITTSAAAASLIVNAAACNLFAFNVKAIDGAVAQKLLVLNSATVPVDGAVVPLKAYDMPAAGVLDKTFDPPIRCGAGCVLVLSSAVTPFTKTIQATAANFAFMSAERA